MSTEKLKRWKFEILFFDKDGTWSHTETSTTVPLSKEEFALYLPERIARAKKGRKYFVGHRVITSGFYV